MRSVWAAVRPMPAQLLIALVRAYRFFLSPWLGSACRFEPTCSAYAMQALERHGAARGSFLIAHRLLRCGPWCDGGHDPVPARRPGLFTRLPGLSASSSTSSTEKTSP